MARIPVMLAVMITMTAVVRRQERSRRDRTSFDILKERYAQGEIDRAEHCERRKALDT